jgi:hypothetical protein
LIFAASLLCETFFFLFPQRRRGAKPPRGLDLRDFPSLRDNLFFVDAKAQKAQSRKEVLIFAPVRRGGQASAKKRK